MSEMQLCHTPAALSAVFDEPNLIACAGLVPAAALADRIGLLDRSTLRVLSVAGAQSRLDELFGAQRPGAGWWVQITRALDDLADAVHSTPGDLIDPEGFTEQIRADAPT